MDHSEKKNIASNWFENIRNQICDAFEELEKKHSPDNPAVFERKAWQRPDQNSDEGGGGTMSIMRGNVFEKVGVNISTVHGVFSEQFRKEIPGTEDDPHFWASGISLVTHPKSPHMPPIHMNTRYIVTQKDWFGGGIDLNPIYPCEEETNYFHQSLRQCCENYSIGSYEEFKKYCDEYFYIQHRKEARGVGGIFFDQLNSGDWDKDFAFVQNVGKTFLETYTQIANEKLFKEWTDEEREYQLHKRGRYAEFNLIYDRGTRFGLQTNGNPDAILMSLPPLVAW